MGLEQLAVRRSTCESKLPLTSGFIDSLLVKHQTHDDYLLLLMHERRLIHVLFAPITEESDDDATNIFRHVLPLQE